LITCTINYIKPPLEFVETVIKKMFCNDTNE
jgi:hypothetical protein